MSWWKAGLAALNPVALVANLGAGVGEYFASEADRKSAETMSKDTNHLNMLLSREASEKNAALQREFAQHGVRWKVEDAVAAGLHPLAALGATGASASPSYQAFQAVNQTVGSSRGNTWRMLGGMGQDVSRAAMAMATPEERAFKALQLQNMQSQNELLNLEVIERGKKIFGSPSVGLPSNAQLPALTGQGNAYIDEQPLRSTHRQPGAPHQDVGHIADMAFARTATGGLAIVPSKDVKERIEDQIIPELFWAARNFGNASLGRHPAPDPRIYPLPKGYTHWRFNPFMQEFRPAKRKSWSMKYRPWKKSWWKYEEE